MSMIEGTEGFTLAKERFVLIGITGQTYSGQSTFFNSVLSLNHFGVMDHRGVFEDIVMSYLDGDPAVVEWYNEAHQNGVELPRYEGDDILYHEESVTAYIFAEEYLKDKEKMHLIRRHSFEKKIERISEAIKEIVDNNAHITKDMQIPLFVDMPMCAGIDYSDYVDRMVVIKRPTEPDINSWYVQYMCADHPENTDNFIDLCVPLNREILLLASDDRAFSEIIVDEDNTTVIENYGTFDEYLEKIETVLDEYRDRSQDALAEQINKLSQEIL